MTAEAEAIFKKLDKHGEDIRKLKSRADMHEKEIERIYQESKDDRDRFNQLHGELKTDIHSLRELLVQFNTSLEQRYSDITQRVSNNEGFWAAMKWVLPLFITFFVAFGGLFAWLYANKPPAPAKLDGSPVQAIQTQAHSGAQILVARNESQSHSRRCGGDSGIMGSFLCSEPFAPYRNQLANGVFLAANIRSPSYGRQYNQYH